MHVPLFEMPSHKGGEAPAVVETPLGRIGVNLCFDAMMPESTRLMAVEGCEIALVPSPRFRRQGRPSRGCGSWDTRGVRRTGVWCGAQLWLEVRVRGRAADVSGLRDGGVAGRGVIREEAEAMLLAELAAERMQAARAAFEYTLRFRRPEL